MIAKNKEVMAAATQAVANNIIGRHSAIIEILLRSLIFTPSLKVMQMALLGYR
jgi:hypothetical protein